MTAEEKQKIVEIIDSEIEKLKEKIEELKEFTAPVEPDCAIGRVSRMDAINNKSIYEASMRNSRKRLSELQQIRQIKDDKNFGICVKCHQSIPVERLMIRPEIRLCAKCGRRG